MKVEIQSTIAGLCRAGACVRGKRRDVLQQSGSLPQTNQLLGRELARAYADGLYRSVWRHHLEITVPQEKHRTHHGSLLVDA